MEEYKPFLSQGYVSINNSKSAKPVKILRDTGASQTLLLEGVLPLSKKTFTGDSVLIQGLELGVIKVPLHKIHLKSELVNGPVIVGIRPYLPIKGVSLLLGNDLAGGRIVAAPVVSNTSYTNDDSDIDDVDLYSARAGTRSKTKYFGPYKIENKISDLHSHFYSHSRSAKKEKNMPY